MLMVTLLPHLVLGRPNIHRSVTYYRSTHCHNSTMSVPTFDQMRKCMAPIWQNKDYQEDILWAGVFGSVARNRAHKGSDVDILIVLKVHERSGEPIAVCRRDSVENENFLFGSGFGGSIVLGGHLTLLMSFM